MCSAVSVFIETNDLIKIQFRSKHPRAKAARFFPSFSVEIQAAILENWRIHLGISQTSSTELEGTLDRTRRWIAGATEWNHVPYHPASHGPEMERIRWFFKSCELLFKVREFGILQFTRCPSPPASYITSQKTFQATYTPSYRCRCFLHSNTCH